MSSSEFIAASGDINQLVSDIKDLKESVLKTQKQCMEQWQPHSGQRRFFASAANLAAYLGLRRHDLRQIQARLANLGLSSLGRSEAHVVASLDAIIYILEVISGNSMVPDPLAEASTAMIHAEKVLSYHTNQLFGPPPSHRWARIMVTFPGEAADDYQFVRELVLRGMDCARINCAHDDRDRWGRMADFVRQAEQETGRSCKVFMDLAGPKLRTGPVSQGPGVIHVKPKRDRYGHFLQATNIILDGSGQAGHPPERDGLGRRVPARISVDSEWQTALQPGDTIHCVDARNKRRKMEILDRRSPHEIMASCSKGIFLCPGIELILDKPDGGTSIKSLVHDIATRPEPIMVHKGDHLLLTPPPVVGGPATLGDNGVVLSPAHISCVHPEVFDFLEPGHRVWINDGHIGAAVETMTPAGALLRIVQARPQGEKLLPEKGLNFPDSDLDFPSLTEKDLQDLDFIALHADMVGYSFVQSAEDMGRLVTELTARNCHKIGIVAKIETQKGLRNLPEIIVRGASHFPFGVMIARGDLAVEIGYARMAEIQEEILWLCEAAHIPVIWATQVLEGLVKKNFPSRAEMTDAAMSNRAECVMLNKGPFVLDAISVLNNVAEKMQAHQQKKTAQLRALQW